MVNFNKRYLSNNLDYVKFGGQNRVLRLKKALYGLKRAQRDWYSHINTHFSKEWFRKCPYEHTLYIKREGVGVLIVCLYVDDLIYTESNVSIIENINNCMMVEFNMSDSGMIHYILGLEVNHSADGIFVSQKKYVQDILDRF